VVEVEAARRVPPDANQALLVLLLLPFCTGGGSKQAFTSDVESKINHLAFFLSKRRKKKSSSSKTLKESTFKDKRLSC